MKILPPTKNSQEPIDVESKTIKVDKFFNDKEKTIKLLLKIEKKTIKIDKLLKRSLASKIKLNEKLRVKKEEESFDKKEQELEKKKPKKMKGMRLPSLPSFGIFDWIKNFISNVVLGFIAVRLIKFLPDLIRLLPIISKVMDFFIDVGGKLLDSLVTFVDWGYKAYDATRGFIKNIFGEDGAKTFEDLSSKFSTFMNIALIAGMLALSGSKKSRGGLGGKGGKIGIDSKGRKVGTKAQERYQRRYGKGKFEDRFGTKNAKKLEKLRRTAGGAGGAGGARAAGTTGARTVAKGGARLATKGIPIVGPLIDFAVRTLIFHEPLGKAAAGAVGVAVGQALGGWLGGAIGGIVGSVIPIAGTLLGGSAGVIIGQLIGGFVGDAIGTSLYDFIGEIGGSTQLAGGGSPDETTRKSNVSGPAARTLKQKKTKRTLTPIPRKISPGASVGGKEKFQQLFPDTQKDNTDTTGKEKQNPYQYLTKSAENIGKAQYFGPLINLGMKANLGDSPNKTDYFLAAQGLNSWMNRILDFRGVAMAGGGEVNAQMLGMGEDYTRVIAKSLEESVSPSIDKTTKDLMRNLMLQKIEPEEEKDEKLDEQTNPQDGGGGSYSSNAGDYKDLLDIIASKESANSGGYNAYNEGGSGGGYTIVGYGGPSTQGPLKRALTDMTISEIMAHQKNTNPPIHAAGRYQIIGQTMRGLMNGGYGPTGVKMDDKFTPDIQDKLGIALIKGRLKSGATTDNFINEWRGLKFVDQKKLQAAINKAQSGKLYHIEGMDTSVQGNLGSEKVSNVDSFTPIAKKFRLTLWSSYRPGDSGWHGANRARDYSNDGVGLGTPEQLAFAKHIYKTYGSTLKELIYTPLGFGIKNGKQVPLSTWGPVTKSKWAGGGNGTNASHYDHVHVAYEDGGETLDGIHLAMIGEKGKEYVLDTGSTKTIQKELPGLLDILNYEVHDVASLKRNAPSIVETLQQYASYEDGSDSEIIVIQDNADDTNDTYPTRSSSSNSMSFSSGIDNKSEEFDVLHMV
jgi:hypothetical protein